MIEKVYKFNLSQVLEKSKKGIDKEKLNDKNINQLALKIKYSNNEQENEELMINLLTLLYINCAIARKVKRAMNNAYCAYSSEDEFFSLFYLTVQQCLQKYEIDQGNFQNYVSHAVDCAFKNENKSGFLKVTGNIPKEKRNSFYAADIEDYDIGKKNSFQHGSETVFMNKSLIEGIAKCDNGKILLCKYLNREKPYTNKQLAVMFGLTEKQIRTRLQKASADFKKTNPDFFLDYFYDSDNLNETIAVQTA